MSYKVLRPQIATLVQGVTGIKEVASYPKLDFKGFPAAYVMPVDNTNIFETTTENQRIYSFAIRVFCETSVNGIQGALDDLDTIIDSLVDLFDDQDQANNRTLGTGLPANYTFLNIEATPSKWGSVPSQKLVMAEVTVKIKLSVDIV